MAVRILSFMSAAAPRTLDFGEIAEGLVCKLRWAHVGKGFWYVRCPQLDCDAFVPESLLEMSGLGAQWRQSSLVCDIEHSGLLFQVVRIHTVH